MKEPIWLDCDPGFDDWMAALLLAANPRLEWLGTSVVAGNAPLAQTWSNAQKIWGHYGLQSALYCDADDDAGGGSSPESQRRETAQHILGQEGMRSTGERLPELSDAQNAGLTTPSKSSKRAAALPAMARALTRGARGDEASQTPPVTLICTGPLTQIAELFRLYPRVKDRVAQIVMMGGSSDRGNHTPAAEFNVFADPEAAAQVFEAGVPIVMLGLNVCRQWTLTQAHVDRLRAIPGKRALWFVGYLDAYQRIRSADGRVPMPIYDPVVAAYLFNPAWFEVQDCRVEVETQGRFTRGMTVCDFKVERLPAHRPSNAKVAMHLQAEPALTWMMDCLEMVLR
jgi:purine nucleosidase